MKTFENVFNKLNELFIEALPDYIRKTNEKYNDGLILKQFENKDLISNCNKLPCFQFSTEEADYSNKDRIIENTVYKVSFKISLPSFNENELIEFWRYVETINLMLENMENNIWQSVMIEKVLKNKIYIKIVL